VLSKGPKQNPAVQPLEFATIEPTVRGLISSGKCKTALDQAKDLHKAHGTPASEALLIDAYMARIQALTQSGLNVEATALLNLVRERFPSAKERLAMLSADNLARSGKLDELLAPLNDPALSPERLAFIERTIQERVYDPGLIASCSALPAEHSLRQAASAVQRAFGAVTTGPVTDEILSLPEVSRRSPLAPWKMLVWALASMYRRDTDACRRYLAAIPPSSAPARLLPVFEAIHGDKKPGPPLTAAADALLTRIQGNTDILKMAAEELDEAFEHGYEDRDVVRAINKAVAECRRTAPAHLEKFKQLVSIRALIEEIHSKTVNAAMGGGPRGDAAYYSMLARSLHLDDLRGEACATWHSFLQKAIEEGWFAAESPEAAAVCLHIAKLLSDLAPWEVEEYKKALRTPIPTGLPTETAALYERASVIDPHPSVFTQWLEEAKKRKGPGAEKVAERWHNARPQDVEPLLFLISAFESRKAYPTALRYLAEAEKIDGLNPDVRKARLRITCANFYRQIQQRPVRAGADKTLAAIGEMPQTLQGDRPAFVRALHYMLALYKQDFSGAEIHRSEIERFLGSATAAALLTSIVARACNFSTIKKPELPKDDRDGLPVKLARIAALAADLGLALDFPRAWVAEAARQFAAVSKALDLSQLRNLGVCALFNENAEFAYDISVEGLRRGSSAEAEFLLLRAQVLLPRGRERAMVCALTAAGIARQRNELEVGAKAVDFLDETFKGDVNKFNAEQIERVLKTEKAETKFPGWGRGPDYLDLLDRRCDCPTCRQARGEDPSSFDIDDDFDEDEDDPFAGTPLDGMPPELSELMLEVMMDGMARNETPEQTMKRLEREFKMGLPFPGKGKKRR
jgi:hypothetical protein